MPENDPVIQWLMEGDPVIRWQALRALRVLKSWEREQATACQTNVDSSAPRC